MIEKKAEELQKQKKAEISIIVYPPETLTGSERMEVKHPENLNLTMGMLLDTIRLMYEQLTPQTKNAKTE